MNSWTPPLSEPIMLSKGFNYLAKWKKINQRVLLLTNNNIGLEIFK